MKKVVKGKQLNTETAKMVGTSMIDADKDIVETLYRTKSGVYFIHNVFRKSTTGKLVVGEDIVIVSYDSAKEWAKKYLTKSEYEEWFENTNFDGTTTITINITNEAYKILKHEKELTNETYGEIISYALKSMF